MKIFAFIFAFYVLCLSIQPGLKYITISADQRIETCCGGTCEQFEKKSPAKQSDKNENADNKTCNPFQACNSCTAFTNDLGCLSLSPIMIFSTSYADNTEEVPAKISLDFWLPPKIG